MIPSVNNTTDDQTEKEKGGLSEFKQKRDEYVTDIRKQKRNENIRKIRNTNMDFDRKNLSTDGNTLTSLSGAFDTPANSQLRTCITEWLKRNFSVQEIDELIAAIKSNDRFKEHYGVIGLRKLLSLDDNPAVGEIVNKGAIPILMNFVTRTDEPHLQLESTWALANVASSETDHTAAIVKCEGVEVFISLLTSDRMETVEHAIWALGNIAGDCIRFRESVIKAGGVPPLIHLVEKSQDQAIIKHGIWALSNICGGCSHKNFQQLCPVLPIFSQALKLITDTEVLTDVCWAIYYLSDGGKAEHYALFLEAGIIPSLGELLESKILSVLMPVIKTFGNLTSDDENLVTAILHQVDLVPRLFRLLIHPRPMIREKACWVLANIAAGNVEQVGLVIGDAVNLSKLISMAVCDKEGTQKEISWIFYNAICRGNMDQIVFMTRNGIIECLISMLDLSRNTGCLEVTLNAINELITKGDIIVNHVGGDNPFQLEIESKGGLRRIDELQRHESTQVYKAALRLLEKHYDTEDMN